MKSANRDSNTHRCIPVLVTSGIGIEGEGFAANLPDFPSSLRSARGSRVRIPSSSVKV